MRELSLFNIISITSTTQLPDYYNMQLVVRWEGLFINFMHLLNMECYLKLDQTCKKKISMHVYSTITIINLFQLTHPSSIID